MQAVLGLAMDTIPAMVITVVIRVTTNHLIHHMSVRVLHHRHAHGHVMGGTMVRLQMATRHVRHAARVTIVRVVPIRSRVQQRLDGQPPRPVRPHHHTRHVIKPRHLQDVPAVQLSAAPAVSVVQPLHMVLRR